MADINEKPVLAFDCSTQRGSVALRVRGVTDEQWLEPGTQAALLVPTIDAMMKKSGVAYRDLDCIVTTLGPGSFTGLRIALATLHGLALAHGTRVKTLTSLQAMAHHFAGDAFAVALHAGKGQFSLQEFRGIDAAGPILLVEAEVVAKRADCYGSHREPSEPFYLAGPEAKTLAEIAARLPETPLAEALPIYIRPPDVTMGNPPPWLQSA